MMKNKEITKNSKIKRIFLAINLEFNIKNELSKFHNKIFDKDCKIKWVNPELMHITLEFLGNKSDRQIKNVSSIVKKISENHKSFIIETSSHLGLFPSSRKPRIIWVGIEKGIGELKRLSILLKKELRKKELLFDDREFKGHITIGRVKYLRNIDLFVDSIENQITKKLYKKVESIELMESKLTPVGPIYNEIQSFPLLK